VQIRLDAVRRAPAAKKAIREYLLQGKAYCGYCGARLIGDSGKSKSGIRHCYYACGNRKKYRICDKKSEKKDFLEWYIVEQTLKYVLTPHRIEEIATGIVKAYDNEFNNHRIKELECKVSMLDKEVDNLVEAIAKSLSKTTVRLTDKIEELETQKASIERDLAALRIANGHKLTKEQIEAWLNSFCKGDELDEKYQKRIMGLFINAIFVYDNKILIYYNIDKGKQVSYAEMCSDLEMYKEAAGQKKTGNNGVRISHKLL